MRTIRTLSVSVALIAAGAGCGRDIVSTDPVPPTDVVLRSTMSRWGVLPILAQSPGDPELVALGQALFFDKVLSGNRDVACATCHNPRSAFGDGIALAVGTGGIEVGGHREPGTGRQHVPRNAPSLVNVGLGVFYLFWDGRLTQFGPPVGRDVEDVPPSVGDVLVRQAMLPVVNRAEMRGERGDIDRFGAPNELAAYGDDEQAKVRQAIMRRLLGIPRYREMFSAAFPGFPMASLGFEHAAQAIAAFERHALRRNNTPFDRYLARDNGALSASAKRGAMLFFGEAQCGSCHSGPLLGGGTFANVGAPQVGPGVGAGAPLDRGRGELFTQFDGYRFAFRAPPLRNVELTAPYMHSGAYTTLDAVVRHYSDVAKAMRAYDVTQLPPSLRSAYHGDEETIGRLLESLDFRVRRPLALTDEQRGDLVAFLRSLTDPAAREFSSLVPQSVPSGLPIDP